MVTRSKSTASAASSEKEDEGQDTTDIELDGHKLYLCSNKGCGVSWGTADELSEHLMVCDMTRDSTALCCVHCGRTFRQIPNLIDHLRNMHGPKRFTCGVCTDEFRVSCLANMYRHFKTKHKSVATVLKPVDPFKNNQDTDKFIVQLKHASPVKSSPKKVSRLNTFSPSEIEQLPKQPIFQTHVQCSECNFSDRVRSNVIRHLKSHIEDKEITRAAPINPMPCLDSRERHFDKMTNWAGSSHRNQDGTLKPPPKRRSGLDLSTGELEKLPRLIPPSCRYVCGADSCAYLTTDLDMLTLHVKNLHAQDSVYTCPHCTNPEPFTGQGTIFERGLAHLRMHGDRLYRCSICQYHHYTRRVVEKHLEEKHDEYPESVLTIREPDTPEFESSPIVNHTWLCSECGFTCHSNDDIRNHCKTEHNIKSQYRCSLCNIRSSGIPTIEQHFSSKHPRENVLMYASYYRSDMSDNKILVGVPTVETHGELINPVPIKPSPAAPAPVEKIKLIRQILVEEVETPLPNSTVVTAPTATSVEKRRSSKEIFEADLIKKFGPLGKPIGSLYSCPICQRFKSKYKHCLRDHLFREFHHKNSTSHSIIRKHLQQVHGVHKDFLKNVSNSKDNPHLEEWVKRVLEHQHSSMFDVTEESPNEKKAIASTLKTTVEPKTHLTKVNVTTPTKLAHATPSSPPKQQSLLKSPSLRQSPRSLLKPQLQPVTPEKVAPAVENVETTTIDLDDDDEDRPLVIEEDTDEDTKKERVSGNASIVIAASKWPMDSRCTLNCTIMD
ncbi:hypothetical protein B566_EDAN006735 [Ephemera danica]|nr:hypothetical protein B566_EDAN006735 [Ephemera danica]